MSRIAIKNICLKFILSVSFATTAFAQEQPAPANTTSFVPNVSGAARDFGHVSAETKLNLVLQASTETNLEEQSSAQDQTGTTIQIIPTYRISPRARVRAVLGGQQTNNGREEARLLNTTLSVLHDPLTLNDDTNLILSAQLLLPTDKDARDETSLRGAAGFAARFNHQLRLLKKNANLSYTLNALQFSHEFTRDVNRTANTSYRLRHVAALDMGLNRSFDLNITGFYQTGWTYDNVLRETYYLEESVSYNLESNVAIALSHSTGGSLFERGGREWAVNFYDIRQSTVGATVTVVY